ncbi:M20 family metallopeptidase [Streptomyces sp. NPDC057702]|uniref:M20 metallopeptidase family protein n=1 Tax=unclassified Streptomyces TaxID=2593676 RepID=UPI0036AF4AC9
MDRHEERALARRTLLAGSAVAGAGLAWTAAGGAGAAGRGPGLSQRVVDGEVALIEGELITLRRDLHRHPEAPGCERRTAGVVARELRAAGLTVTTGVGGHGVVGVLRGARPGRTVAYRADMDAVPPQDIIGEATAPAHLCGHDLHTTMGVGIARVLARHRRHLGGTLVLLFQPAEESLSGAGEVIETGVLDRLGVQEIHALHCGPFPVGRFATTAGFGMPGQDKAELTLSGPDGPEAAQRLAAELGALATVATPRGDADLERVVADSLVPDGPLARFVALQARARAATVSVSYRCWPPERHAEVREDIRRAAARFEGARVRFPGDPFPALVCPEPEGRALARHLRRTLGRGAVTPLRTAFPPFSGEDFALFLNRMPGTFTYLGVRTPGTPITASYPHFPTFVPDERAIGIGVRAMAGWLARRGEGA